MVKPTVSLNAVADDLVWKDHVSRELRNAKEWPKNWSFLTEKKDQDSVIKRSKSKDEDEVKLPPITNNTSKQDKNYKPFPQTSSAFIGWKAMDPKNNVDHFGPYTTPIRTFLRQMKWPAEAMI